MKIEMSKTFKKRLAGRIERFNFEVGVLDDKPHKNPKLKSIFGEPDLTTYAGGPVAKLDSSVGPLSTAEIFVENMKRLNINLLLKPFRDESSEIIKFTQAFLKLATGRKGISIKRVENLLQAVVRNPIFRKEYGNNTSATADAKGFDRHLFDTGQMFKAIKARAKRV